MKKTWTPELIAGRLKQEKPYLHTNYESIYQWIYTDRRDLIAYLPRGHKTRRKRCGAKNKRSVRIPNRIMIDKRPPQIGERTEAGHWEADTAVSRQSKAAIAATVERTSRFLIAKKLQSKTSNNMHTALCMTLKRFPQWLRQSITYDNGTENVCHEQTNRALKTQSYFCNPYHSWEKGSIENRIGIIRRFFPKKTDWSLITQRQLDRVIKIINTRPMKCLGFKTPQEVFVALTH